MASSDLVNMGITVVSYTLKDIRDDEVRRSAVDEESPNLNFCQRVRRGGQSVELLSEHNGGIVRAWVWEPTNGRQCCAARYSPLGPAKSQPRSN